MPVDKPNNAGKGSAAEDMVFDNLGLKGSDLGMDSADSLDVGDQAELESDQADRGFERDQDRPERDQDRDQIDIRERVTHTEETRPFAQTAEVKPDGKGNLIDSEGKIVAKAGREARLYQTAFKRGQTAKTGPLERQVTERTNQLREAAGLLRDMDTEIKTLRAANKAADDLGVPADKRIEAFTLYQNLTKDFGGTLKRLLTRAAANGININEFGQTGPDAKALADLVKDEVSKLVQPLRDQADESRKRQQADEENRQTQLRAEREVQTFFTENPEARQYTQVLQRLVGQPENRGRSLEELWLRVQLHLARNPAQRRQQNSGNQSRSLPSGRGQPERGNTQLAPVSASYDEILKDVFKEHGM